MSSVNETVEISTLLSPWQTFQNGSASITSATGSPPESPEMMAWRWLILISAPIIFIVGILGNALTLLVLATSSFRHVSASVYLMALAVVDTVCLFSQRLTRTWLELMFNVMLDVVSRTGCKMLMWVHYSASCGSSWLIVAVTIERLIITCFPLRAKILCTRRNALCAVAAILTLALLANLYTVFMFDIINDEVYDYCTQPSANDVRISTFIDFTLYSLIPSLVLWTANACIIHKLRKSKAFQRVSVMSRKKNDAKGMNPHRNTTVMLLVISFTFLFLTTPVSLHYVLKALITIRETDGIVLTQQFLQVLSSLNHAINFFLYCLSGHAFRTQLFSVFRTCCSCRHSRQTCRKQKRGRRDSQVTMTQRISVTSVESVMTTLSSIAPPELSTNMIFRK